MNSKMHQEQTGAGIVNRRSESMVENLIQKNDNSVAIDITENITDNQHSSNEKSNNSSFYLRKRSEVQ